MALINKNNIKFASKRLECFIIQAPKTTIEETNLYSFYCENNLLYNVEFIDYGTISYCIVDIDALIVYLISKIKEKEIDKCNFWYMKTSQFNFKNTDKIGQFNSIKKGIAMKDLIYFRFKYDIQLFLSENFNSLLSKHHIKLNDNYEFEKL